MSTVEWVRKPESDLGRMTTADLGLPHWADNTARSLLLAENASTPTLVLHRERYTVVTPWESV